MEHGTATLGCNSSQVKLLALLLPLLLQSTNLLVPVPVLVQVTVPVPSTTTTTNKVAVASAAPRGVSFIFGSFFGQKLENPEFCVVFVRRRCIGPYSFKQLFVLFFGEVFAEVSQIPCFSSLIFVDFLESFKNSGFFAWWTFPK